MFVCWLLLQLDGEVRAWCGGSGGDNDGGWVMVGEAICCPVCVWGDGGIWYGLNRGA